MVYGCTFVEAIAPLSDDSRYNLARSVSLATRLQKSERHRIPREPGRLCRPRQNGFAGKP
jgi:hypothetical protein